MTFDEVLDQVRELLRQRGRLTYGAVKRRFDLDEAYLEDIKGELIEAEQVAKDEDGRVLVWVGREPTAETENRGNEEAEQRSRESSGQHLESNEQPPTPSSQSPAERRQLTVMFCDLVGSTTLSAQLDPEEYHEVISLYQATCTAVIQRYAGHIAQHLGDGLLVYFGYPVAHEDDAQRAVRTGLEILATLAPLNARLPFTLKARLLQPVSVRIGVHTGLVVIGEIGSREKREMLALGETPNIAARVQGVAEPDTMAISAVTQRLVQGLFESQDLGPQTLKGISTPLSLYRVIGESVAQSRFEVSVQKGLTPLVGREAELGVLQQRWEQAKAGAGQVVMLSGEPGIGKSRLVQELKERISAEGSTRIEFRCSPYHQNSALYPIIDHLQRLLQFARDDSPATKLEKLQSTLGYYRFPQADTVRLLAALLSLPHPEGYPPITVSLQKQKEKTQAALVAWLVEEAERNPVYTIWEDLHWADPSTLEVLTLLLDQVPTTRLLVVQTFRPEFTPLWGSRSYLTQLILNRLERPQVEAMVERVTGRKALPSEVVQQIVAKTDGVPLFVEELTKTVLESGLVCEEGDRYVGARGGAPIPPLAIPSTLQDSLMARLDRLAPVKELAQLGATLGRKFSYEVLHAVSPLDEGNLQQGLRQLVEAELLYQRGLPPQAIYLFKHTLIQDTAYQSLLKSRRQQLHQQIAQVLAERFPEIVETQPELLAHHYTEAGLREQAIPYWQQAGQRAVQRSANTEAVAHFTKGLELLKTLPDTSERTQQELQLQLALGPPLMAITSIAASQVKQVYARALELCRQLGETLQLLPVLSGLRAVYLSQGDYQTARGLAEQSLRLAQSVHDTTMLLLAHLGMGNTLYYFGKFSASRQHLEQALALYDPQQHNPHAARTPVDPGVGSLFYLALVLWHQGYPEQALQKKPETLSLAQKLSHPLSLAYAYNLAAKVHLWRREAPAVFEQTKAILQLADEHGMPYWVAEGRMMQGWALAEQGQVEEGITQMREGLAHWRSLESGVAASYFLSLPVAAYGKGGQVEEGLTILAEALEIVRETGEGNVEAELYRLKGELLLQQSQDNSAEAEACFHKAIDVARRQEAKSWELRAATSLARLWQQQGKKAEAWRMLAEIYNWFTEGFDTKDLQEAKALLEELSH